MGPMIDSVIQSGRYLVVMDGSRGSRTVHAAIDGVLVRDMPLLDMKGM